MRRNQIWLAVPALLTLVALSAPVAAAPEAGPQDPKQLQQQIEKLQGAVDELRKSVEQLQRDVVSLRNTPTTTRKTFYDAPAAGTGRIRLINTFPTRMTVIINDRSYRLEPGAEQIIDKPAGVFHYQVLGVQPELLVRNLAPNETFTITVFQR